MPVDDRPVPINHTFQFAIADRPIHLKQVAEQL
jgi:hypothetical protein